MRIGGFSYSSYKSVLTFALKKVFGRDSPFRHFPDGKCYRTGLAVFASLCKQKHRSAFRIPTQCQAVGIAPLCENLKSNQKGANCGFVLHKFPDGNFARTCPRDVRLSLRSNSHNAAGFESQRNAKQSALLHARKIKKHPFGC